MKRLQALLGEMERDTPACEETIRDFYGFTVRAYWNSDEAPTAVVFDITQNGEVIETGVCIDDALAIIVTSIPFGTPKE